MSDPALEFFQTLERKSEDKRKVHPGERTYPGTTPPRNAGPAVDSDPLLWLDDLPYRELLAPDGTARKFYTIGTLAKALGKANVTIRSWEDKGWIPKATYRTQPPRRPQVPGKKVVGQRLYTKEQLRFLVVKYNEFIESRDTPDWPGFRKAIKSQYPKQ